METTNNTSSNCTLFENRTLQKVFLHEAIIAVLKKRKMPLRLENVKDERGFFSDIVDYVTQHESHNLYNSWRDVKNAFAKYGINSGAELMIAMYDRREELAKQGYPMDKIKDPKEIIRKYNIQGHTSYVGMDTERTVVVRSKYGNFPLRFYNFVGPLEDGPQLRAIQYDYHISTGCPYFERRPILLSTWLELPEERKYATCNVDSTDLDFEEAM